MTDSIVPDWIKSIKEQRDRVADNRERERQGQLLVERTIQAGGMEFWKQLCRDLHIAVEGLSLLGVNGTLSDVGMQDGVGEYVLQIRLSTGTTTPRGTYTNVFFKPSDSAIRFYTLEDEADSWSLCVKGDTVMLNVHGRPTGGESAAKAILVRIGVLP